MSIYTLLSTKMDPRRKGNDCSFNGFLQDYLSINEDINSKALNRFLKINEDFYIICNYHLPICSDSISNSIIRYKDINKLDNEALLIPYILYERKEDGNAYIIFDDNYIYAIASYFALTEHEEYKALRNNMLAFSLGDVNTVVDDHNQKLKPSVLQRKLDKKHFKNYEDVLNICTEQTQSIEKQIDELPKDYEEKEEFVKACIRKWYLLKKCLYVKYMVDKGILKERHNNVIKSQRSKAKENADSIRFMSISSIWEKIK
ncbi:MAG: hypothetical protein Q4E33_01615 [Erysipelotrichaceae bacterium]|nr:hypothetical protein [Erysipelotrichaceae bacterium]